MVFHHSTLSCVKVGYDNSLPGHVHSTIKGMSFRIRGLLLSCSRLLLDFVGGS